MEDLSRLDDRVRKLQAHFGQASQGHRRHPGLDRPRSTKRGQKIEALEFGGEAGGGAGDPAATEPSVISRTGQLKLRVVDGDE